MSLINQSIDLNDIITSLINERMKKEEENPNEKAINDYNKLKELLDKEKITNEEQITHEQKLKEIQDKIEEKSKKKNKTTKEVKKTWSKLSSTVKSRLIDEYFKKNNIKDKILKEQLLNKTINPRKIVYDKENEIIISIKE